MVRLEDRMTIGELLKAYQLRTGANAKTIANLLGRGFGETSISGLINDGSPNLVDPERLRTLCQVWGCTYYEYTQVLRAAGLYPTEDELTAFCAMQQPRLDQFSYPAHLQGTRGYLYAVNHAWTDLFGIPNTLHTSDQPIPTSLLATPSAVQPSMPPIPSVSNPLHLLQLLLDPRQTLYRITLAASVDEWTAWASAELDGVWYETHRQMVPKYGDEPEWRKNLLAVLDALPVPGSTTFRQLWRQVRQNHASEEAEERTAQRLNFTLANEQFAPTPPFLDTRMIRLLDTSRNLDVTLELSSKSLAADARFRLVTWTPVALRIPLAIPPVTPVTEFVRQPINNPINNPTETPDKPETAPAIPGVPAVVPETVTPGS